MQTHSTLQPLCSQSQPGYKFCVNNCPHPSIMCSNPLCPCYQNHELCFYFAQIKSILLKVNQKSSEWKNSFEFLFDGYGELRKVVEIMRENTERRVEESDQYLGKAGRRMVENIREGREEEIDSSLVKNVVEEIGRGVKGVRSQKEREREREKREKVMKILGDMKRELQRANNRLLHVLEMDIDHDVERDELLERLDKLNETNRTPTPLTTTILSSPQSKIQEPTSSNHLTSSKAVLDFMFQYDQETNIYKSRNDFFAPFCPPKQLPPSSSCLSDPQPSSTYDVQQHINEEEEGDESGLTDSVIDIPKAPIFKKVDYDEKEQSKQGGSIKKDKIKIINEPIPEEHEEETDQLSGREPALKKVCSGDTSTIFQTQEKERQISENIDYKESGETEKKISRKLSLGEEWGTKSGDTSYEMLGSLEKKEEQEERHQEKEIEKEKKEEGQRQGEENPESGEIQKLTKNQRKNANKKNRKREQGDVRNRCLTEGNI